MDNKSQWFSKRNIKASSVLPISREGSIASLKSSKQSVAKFGRSWEKFCSWYCDIDRRTYGYLTPFLKCLVYCALYAGIAQLALQFIIYNLASFWPSNGVFVAGLIILGRRYWWMLTILMIITIMGSNLGVQTLFRSFMFGVVNSVECLSVYLSFSLLTNWAENVVNSKKTAIAFLVASVIGTLIGGSLGGVFIGLSFYNEAFCTACFVSWFVSDLLGILMVTPFMLSVRSRKDVQNLLEMPWQLAGCLASVAAIIVSQIFLTKWNHNVIGVGNGVSMYVAFPLILVSGLLCGVFGFGLSICAFGFAAAFTIVSLEPSHDNKAQHAQYIVNKLINLQIVLLLLQITCYLFMVIQEEKKAAYQQVVKSHVLEEQANRQKSEFMSFLCHELRNPLHAIINTVGFLESQDQNCRESFDTIKLSSQYMVDIINDVLDVNKFEAGRVKLEKMIVDLPQLMDRLVAISRGQLRSKQIMFEAQIGALPNYVWLDATRFQQIVLNLVSNSAKFTPSGHMVQFQISALNESQGTCDLAFEIHDHGIGMKKETMENLFRPFVQGNESIPREYGGSGLGLSICHQIVGLMGGKITVTSELGVGSVFTVTIPVLISNESPFTKRSESATTPVSLEEFKERIHILIVDDSTINRTILKRMFNSLGVKNIQEYSDGAQIVEAMADLSSPEEFREPIIIFMDLQMPVMDGHEAARRIRKLGWKIPIVVSTANNYSHDMISHFTDYVGKPFAIKQAQDLLEKYAKTTIY